MINRAEQNWPAEFGVCVVHSNIHERDNMCNAFTNVDTYAFRIALKEWQDATNNHGQQPVNKSALLKRAQEIKEQLMLFNSNEKGKL